MAEESKTFTSTTVDWKSIALGTLVLLQAGTIYMVKTIMADGRESRDTARANAQWVQRVDPIINSNTVTLSKHEKNLVILNYINKVSETESYLPQNNMKK
jgi:hypothetical protein